MNVITAIFIDRGGSHCNPKPVPVNVSYPIPFWSSWDPHSLPPALSAHVPLAQTSPVSTQTQCPGMAPVVVRLALQNLNQYCRGQLDLPENLPRAGSGEQAPSVRGHR